ncbi:hypothetical protein IC575_014264 [Cucumis melo]
MNIIEKKEDDSSSLPKEWRYTPSHPKDLILGNPKQGVKTRSFLNLFSNLAFVSQIEPRSLKDVECNEFWILAIQEELNQFERNKVCELDPRPSNTYIIGTKWVFGNKMDENKNIIRNKAILIAQGYGQEEGIDYEETFALIARLEAIRMLIAFYSYKNFILYQMDVKSAFLNGYIMEEVYVEQPSGFESFDLPNHVYKLKKAFYDLKQTPRASYDRLSNFSLENDFKCMHNDFEMSMMGELSFFLGLQIKQLKDDIFISQEKYIRDLLKRFKFNKGKITKTSMSTTTKLDKDEKGKCMDIKTYRGTIESLLYLTASKPDIMFSVCLCARFQSCSKELHLHDVKRILKYLLGTIDVGLWYPRNVEFNLVGYSDADFAGSLPDRKSTSWTCQFLGSSLVSWFSKKKNLVALSTTKAQYIMVSSCCAQILWMKQTLCDFGLKFDNVPIFCDNTSVINLTKNPIHHSRAKHIDIRHHFIREHVQNGHITLEFVSSNDQLVDIFTKPLNEENFYKNRLELGIIHCDAS